MSGVDLRRGGLALAVGALVSFATARAHAFCRTTTCDPKVEHCNKDSDGCVIEGKPLIWREHCISFATQKDGSKQVPYAVADGVFRAAFMQWAQANCGGEHPSFEVWDVGPVECNEPEFNDFLPNANVWMFRDDSWPYHDDTQTLALTTVLFERGSGVILDADVEVNSHAMQITTGTTDVKRDLQSIATHEAGHFLGLSHTLVKGATMQAQYTQGDLNYRSLSEDDRKAICDAYPPNRVTPICSKPTPAHGFSPYCFGGDSAPKPPQGCSVDSRGGAGREPGAAFLVALSLAAFRRRRKRVSA
ncbi:MAG TPA: matrixin family metalloprotease [Polyangiaceae bacterium]|nr:matrixin family metalloprotease [Polyangiaceae bacterium]